MPYSEDIEKKIKSFYSIEDIISAMKAYAGVSIDRRKRLCLMLESTKKIYFPL